MEKKRAVQIYSAFLTSRKMEIVLLCFVISLSFRGKVAIEGTKRSTRSRIIYTHHGFTPINQFTNSYVGPVRHKVVIRCKAIIAESFPDIQWYRLVPDNFTCANQSRTLRTIEGKFCPETRTQFFVRQTRRFTKYMSKLILERPMMRDSGMYMCIISSRDTNSTLISKPVNATLLTKLAFHKTEDPPLRVIGGRIYGQGAVEIYINNKWKGINPNSWDSVEANLACRLLGYGNGGEASGQLYMYFWPRKNLFSLNCPVNSTSLGNCSGFYETNITRPQAAVYCRSSQAPPMRFTGPSPSEGRVEVYFQGQWGSICKKGITETESSTICRILGYNYGGVAAEWFLLPDFDTPILMGNIQCPENASALAECYYNTSGIACCSCNNREDSLALRCRVRPDEDDPNLRVRLAAYGSERKGRVEVYYERRRTWVTVKADYLQEEEANMFCKMLGFQYGGEPMIVYPGYENKHISSMSCPLNASTIEDCSIDWDGYGRATEPGGVECRVDPLKVPEIPFRIGRNDRGEEKLQYYNKGYWGTVCGASIGTPEAFMVCSMLGHRYGGSFNKSSGRRPYRGFGPILLKNLDCPINSTSLNQCSYRTYSNKDYCTHHGLDVSVRCYDQPQNRSLPIRLKGKKTNKGILQVFHDDKWRFVTYGKNPQLAAVVCRQLGFRNGGEMYPSDKCTSKRDCDMQRSLSGYSDCTGKEENVGQCNSLYWGNWSVKPTEIYCYLRDDNPFGVSLTEREDDGKQGAVVITKKGERYFICATQWDDIHARTFCRSAGYSDGTPIYYKQKYYSYYRTDKMIIAMYCQRGVDDLRQCFHTAGDDWDWDCFTYPIRAGVSCIP